MIISAFFRNNNIEVNGHGDSNESSSPQSSNSSPVKEATSPTRRGVKKVWSPTSPKAGVENGFSGNDNDVSGGFDALWCLYA